MFLQCKSAKLHDVISQKTVCQIFINLKFEGFWDMTLCELVAVYDVSQQVDTSIFRVVTEIPGRSSSRCVNKSGVCCPRGFQEIQNERLQKNQENIRNIITKL
jgi:hypothetical protein